MIPAQEKLAAVERLIEDFRWARSDDRAPEHQTYVALKAIAEDLRADLAGVADALESSLGARVAGVARKSTPGARYGALQGVGEQTVGAWPVISRALRMHAAKIEEGVR